MHATQFFEFMGSIVQPATEGQAVRLPSALFQPFVSDDVTAVMVDVAVEPLAGSEPIRLDEVVRQFLSANRDARKVITDVNARNFGIEVNDQSLTPGVNPRLGTTHFEDWLRCSIPQG